VTGACSSSYKKYLLQKISELGIEGNVTFNDYFPFHSDMHQHITQGRCAVLPIKLDVTSSALKEAMLLEIPVVTYKTSGTPYLNKDGECVLISEIDDVQGLAKNMIKVIQNPDYAKNMAIKAKAFVEREFDNTMSAKRLRANYYAVLDHYHNGTPIPEELLFNTDEFPSYN
jgi:glycosyltransferase involved in cell wall biosynthesis